MSKRSFTINSKWEHGDYTGLLLKGQDIKCEKKLPKALQHAKSKIEADNCDELDITLLTFALMNSSHQLMEREPEEQAQSVSKLRKIRNAQYEHAFDLHAYVWRIASRGLASHDALHSPLPVGSNSLVPTSNRRGNACKEEKTVNQLQCLLKNHSIASSLFGYYVINA